MKREMMAIHKSAITGASKLGRGWCLLSLILSAATTDFRVHGPYKVEQFCFSSSSTFELSTCATDGSLYIGRAFSPSLIFEDHKTCFYFCINK